MQPEVMLISDGTGAPPDRLIERIRLASASGVRLAVQIREKTLTDRALLETVRQVVDGLGPRAVTVLVLVNGRLDIARVAGADGVHLPADGAPVERVREVARSLRVGVSTHSSAEIRRARERGADYALFGPVFATPSKRGMGEPRGIGKLEEAVSEAGGMPVLAVGGVTVHNAAACRAAGAAGVAVIRAWHEGDDPAETLRRLACRDAR